MLSPKFATFLNWSDPCPSFRPVWQVNGDASKTALDSQLRRICCPKPASGKLEVSAEIYRQWKAGGAQRKLLLDQLVKCNGDKEIYAVNHAVIKHKLLYALQAHELLMYLRVCIYLYKFFQPCWRSNSKSTLSTCRKSLAETMSMWRRVSTRRRRWKQPWVGRSHVLSHVEPWWI